MRYEATKVYTPDPEALARRLGFVERSALDGPEWPAIFDDWYMRRLPSADRGETAGRPGSSPRRGQNSFRGMFPGQEST